MLSYCIPDIFLASAGHRAIGESWMIQNDRFYTQEKKFTRTKSELFDLRERVSRGSTSSTPTRIRSSRRMDALVNRVTTIINRQNALLEATLVAGVRTEGPPVNGPPSLPAAEAGTAPVETTDGEVTDPNNALQLELSNWSSRAKFMVPIIVLILLKILADHILTGFVVILCTTSFYRLKTAFELELSLKDRSSSVNLVGLLLGSMGLLYAMIVEIRLLNYHDSISDRLQFHLPESKLGFNLLNILWVCIVTDGVVQLMVLVCKILVVNVVGLFFKIQGSGFKCRAGKVMRWQFELSY